MTEETGREQQRMPAHAGEASAGSLLSCQRTAHSRCLPPSSPSSPTESPIQCGITRASTKPPKKPHVPGSTANQGGLVTRSCPTPAWQKESLLQGDRLDWLVTLSSFTSVSAFPSLPGTGMAWQSLQHPSHDHKRKNHT